MWKMDDDEAEEIGRIWEESAKEQKEGWREFVKHLRYFTDPSKLNGEVEFVLKPFDEKETVGGEEALAMSSVEEFLILALKDLFHIDHFMTDQGNHIFIDNDPGYYKEKHLWKFTPEELKTKLLSLQHSLSQPQH